MAGNIANFGGKKAAPFGKKRNAAKAVVSKNSGGLTAAQQKLPPALKAAILRKQGKSGK